MTVRKFLPLDSPCQLSEDWHLQIQQSSTIEDAFDKYDSSLRAISLKIHGYKELSFQEHRSAALLADFLEREMFTVERGVAGDSTAFLATFTQGIGPVVSFNAVQLIIFG
jgi:metal-dependent amidase/aminoacylase/carboxypeptidase family protein